MVKKGINAITGQVPFRPLLIEHGRSGLKPEMLQGRFRKGKQRETGTIETICAIADMQYRAKQIRHSGKTIAFVPTMGYLHDGHLSLMKKGRALADQLIASIFVNPAQFGPNEDLSAYPRNPEGDAALAAEAGVDFLFTPAAKDMYPEGFETYIIQTKLPEHLCGLSRPGHFKGVMTIVAKLFNIVQPHFAVFGEKDFQQLAVIRKMTRELNFDTKIIGAPTVRDSGGLAMSSRNQYLTEKQRRSALSLYRSLAEAHRRVAAGETDAVKIIDASSAAIEAEADTAIDYIAIADPETLENLHTIDRPAVMALAVKVGNTRLIDNMALLPPNAVTGGNGAKTRGS